MGIKYECDGCGVEMQKQQLSIHNTYYVEDVEYPNYLTWSTVDADDKYLRTYLFCEKCLANRD